MLNRYAALRDFQHPSAFMPVALKAGILGDAGARSKCSQCLCV